MADAGAHNSHDISFLNHMVGSLNATVTLARDHLANGQHEEVSNLAAAVISSHATQLANAVTLARELGRVTPPGEQDTPSVGPEVDGSIINTSTLNLGQKAKGAVTSTGSTAGTSGNSGNGGGGGGGKARSLAFSYETRAAMTAKSVDSLPDSEFAYVEPGGTKDTSGRTTPRSLRHFPIHDAAHVRNALARAPQSPFGKKAMPAILAAAKKFGVETSQSNSHEAKGFAYRVMPFQTRSAGSGDGLTLEGYAAVFNSPTQISSWEGDFQEVIAPGAFKRSLQDRMPVLMFEHGRHPLIGTMPLGVIQRASEDTNGLYIQAKLSDNWLIQPVRDAVRDGAVSGMSFRFSVPEGGDTWENRGRPDAARTIHEANTSELGPVVFPAYEPTTAAIRSLVEAMDFPLDDQGRGASVATGFDAAAGVGATSLSKEDARIRDRVLAMKMRGILK